MPSFYHGSVRLYLRDLAVRLGKDARNGWRKLMRRNRGGSGRKADKRKLEDELGRIAHSQGREATLAFAASRIEDARQADDPRELHYLAGALERLEAYDVAYALRTESHARMRHVAEDRVWDGRPLPQGNLAVTPMRYDAGSLSYSIQYAGLIAQAGARAPGATVYLPERLVPLFARSYPDINARPDSEFDPERPQTAFEAPLDRLASLFATSEAAIRTTFAPLAPDPALVAELRSRYGAGQGPIIGIAWGSTNSRKDVPAFPDWTALLERVSGPVVSLQYGDVKQARRRLEQASGTSIIVDPQVDQMQDMDAFAAQLAAMDVIVSISGTGAHLAGALGRPMHVLLDDLFHLTWPYYSNRTPWYPAARLHRRAGRPWQTILGGIGRQIEEGSRPAE